MSVITVDLAVVAVRQVAPALMSGIYINGVEKWWYEACDVMNVDACLVCLLPFSWPAERCFVLH